MYPYSSSEFGRTGYKSCYLTWNSNDSEDLGFYVEPLPYCHEDLFYKSNFHNYRDGEDDVNACGSANLLGDYFSHFVWDEFKISEGYDAFNDKFNGLKMLKDSSDFVGWDKYKFSEGCDGLDMVKDPYKDELYDSYCDFGFQYRVDEDCGASELKSIYSQSWETWDEMGIYERIFGNWDNMLRSDTESRVEAELA